VDRAVVQTVHYARAISPNVTALHITDDPETGNALRERWERAVLDVPLLVIDSPYRSFVAPLIAYLEATERTDAGQYVTVVLPEFRTPWPWQRWLHNQSARRLRDALLDRPNTAVCEFPLHLSAPDAEED
jgi:hypothetical protein